MISRDYFSLASPKHSLFSPLGSVSELLTSFRSFPFILRRLQSANLPHLRFNTRDVASDCT